MRLDNLHSTPSNVRNYGADMVAILKDKGDKCLVKVLNSRRYRTGATIEVNSNDLSKPQRKTRIRNVDGQCPRCGAGEYCSGVECGCGYKE